ncbi:MAG TPA: YkgJ family cysteine cluster protein [Burkholderiales bacterium]|nr:YkgJ family cysteine cluster protein [Burkholderiales bacterium]
MNPNPNSRELQDPAAPRVTCASCTACCCRLEVILMGDDDVPTRLTEVDRWGGSVMARLEDGWCAALDRDTMLCTIYESRPGVCREYEMGGSDCLTERALHVAK